jgi:hypothetical protein
MESKKIAEALGASRIVSVPKANGPIEWLRLHLTWWRFPKPDPTVLAAEADYERRYGSRCPCDCASNHD